MTGTVERKADHLNTDTEGLTTWLLVFSVLCLESLLVSVASKTALNLVFYILPFRLFVWGIFFDYSLRRKNLPGGVSYWALFLPYVLTCVFFSGFIWPLELGKLSYYCGMLFTPFFLGFVSAYLLTQSLGFCLEVLCLLCVIVLAFLHVFFYDTLISLWYSLFLPYHHLFASYGVKLTQEQLYQISSHVAGVMTSSVVVNYFLAPICVSAIVVFYYNFDERKESLKDWLSLRMSWFSFYLALPLFFVCYGMMALQQLYPKMQIWHSLGALYGFFEVVRFIPCVCGLSYIHYMVYQKYIKLPKKCVFWSSLLTMVFYVFGYFLYPVCSFIGLIDRIIDLRQASQKAKPSTNLS